MSLPDQPRGTWSRRCALRRCVYGLKVCLILILAGCQVIPAHHSACRHPHNPVPRTAIVIRQVAVDTALETAHHPIKSLGTVAIEPVLALRGAAAGLRKRAQHFLPAPDPIAEGRVPLDSDALEAELGPIAGDELEPAAIQLYLDGKEALTALEQAIDEATCRIDVLMYLWDNDPLGWELARRLAAKAGPNLCVRVLVDGGGNLLQGTPENARAGQVNEVVCWLAAQPHVQVFRTRNPFCRFDHRKLVIIDGRLVWSGGRNFTHESFFVARDLTYTLVGPLTGELATRFDNFWQEQGGRPGPPAPEPIEVAEPNTKARLVRTRPYESNLARTIYTAVDHARHHIYVENPYFTDHQLFVKLVQARRRGVDVRVVLTLQSGSGVVDIVNKVTINRLLRAGIRVYLYPGRTHVKALSVDGCWAYMGTGNFDRLSLRHNRELGVAISHGTVVSELEERLFQNDFQPEWEAHERLPLAGYEYVVEALMGVIL